MKNQSLRPILWVMSLLSLVLIGLSACQPASPERPVLSQEARMEKMHLPSEHFFLQRSYPDTIFDIRAYELAMKSALRQSSTSTRNSNTWVTQGPGNIGGRINVVTIHPTNPNIIYVGSAAGGIHKTADGGQTWSPIFDDFAYLSIGAITLDPSDPNVVYVGTGDPNITGFPFIGDGVYKSLNGGQTWTHLGLTDQRIVSRIVVHPTNPQIVFVATMGLPFERNNQRGLYRSLDGGQNWTQVLFASNQAGVIDLLMDPFDPNVLYAATWDRIRNNEESVASGNNAGIWKSTDGGANWVLLTGGGFPSIPQGRIGLAISQQTPNLVFALVVGTNSQAQGVYKSFDGGQSWTNHLNDLANNALGGFGWYFGQIRVNPTDDDELWILGVDLHGSADGGSSWNRIGPPWWTYEVHADKHDLQFDQAGNIYLSTDGGLYKSTDGGNLWTDIENIPNTQFYRVALNPHTPGTYYGGAQDNGSTGGNQSNFNNWPRIYGGDGFQMRFHPTDPDIFYCETQNGNLVYTNNGGGDFFSHTNGIDNNDRRNWDMPFVLSSVSPDRQYTGTYRVYRNAGGAGGLWIPISPDLTDGDLPGVNFHTISTVNESPVAEQVLYAGTADGNVWVTTSSGNSWTDITAGLPNRYVSSVKPSPLDSSVAYVAHSGYKYNDFIPHIHRTDDYGATWVDISGNLPQLAINDIYLYPNDDKILFVATDGGVYFTLDGGVGWNRVGNNMPIIPVYDLEIEFTPGNEILVAGTHARSLMTFELGALFPPAAPSVNYVGDLQLCEGESIELQAPSGFAGYLWNTGDTTQNLVVTASGVYQVSVLNDYGLSSIFSDSILVTVYPYPPSPTVQAVGELCQGESVVLYGPGGYANYYWSTGTQGPDSIEVSQAGTYSLIVESPGGCTSPLSSLFVLEVSPMPTAGFSFQPAPVTIQFNNSSQDASSYLWDFGDGSSSTDPNPLHDYPNTGGGDYQVQLIVSNDCGSDTIIQTVAVYALGLEAPTWLAALQLYPNPASDFFQIQGKGLQNQPLELSLWNLQGQRVWKQEVSVENGSLQAQISVEEFTAGMYLLQLKQGDQVGSKRVIVK